VNPRGRIDEILDQSIRRLGAPPSEVLESARDRIRQNLRSTDASQTPALSDIDVRPAGLWGLRQPFLIAASAVLALAALTATSFWIVSGRTPAPDIASVPPEPAPPASAAPPATPTESKEVAAAPGPVITKQIPRQRTVTRPLPKPEREEVKPLDAPPVTGIDPAFPVERLPEPVTAPPDENSGRTVLEQVCTVCHSLRGIEKHSYASPDAYKALVSEMISRGAVISDEEMAVIVEYLYKTYGQR
jgi:hypothetical protein